MAKVTRLSLDGSGGLDRRRLHLREISDEQDTPLDTVGQDLRKARLRKGEDLAQVSQALKVRKGYLEAIEESDLESLPGRTYAIGFVRSYAEYLGLDAEAYVNRLKAEIAGRDDEREGKVQVATPVEEKKLPPGAMIFGFVLVVALLYGIYYLFAGAGRVQTPPVAPVPARLAPQAQAQIEPPAPVAAAPDAAPFDAATPAPDTDVASATPPAESAAPPAEPENTDAAPLQQLPRGSRYGLGNTNSRITLRIHRQTRLRILGADDRPFINRILNPGDTYAAPNVTGLKVTTPDLGAVEVILDGSPMGYLGGNGVAANEMSLEPQAIVDHQPRG